MGIGNRITRVVATWAQCKHTPATPSWPLQIAEGQGSVRAHPRAMIRGGGRAAVAGAAEARVVAAGGKGSSHCREAAWQ